jgi:hypothetical protein
MKSEFGIVSSDMMVVLNFVELGYFVQKLKGDIYTEIMSWSHNSKYCSPYEWE